MDLQAFEGLRKGSDMLKTNRNHKSQDIGTTAGFGAYPNGKISLPLCANTRRRKDEDCDGLRSSLYSNEVAPFKMTIFLRFGVDVNND
uniref:Alpha-carbonic anhydrase domain-containing protein n=1 Tax=Steinernema glaseri TaxID=37863 RepID=A0A1I7Z824_9BILA